VWHSDVSESEIYKRIWGEEGKTWKDVCGGGSREELDKGQRFLDKVQSFKESKGKDVDKELGGDRGEIEGVIVCGEV